MIKAVISQVNNDSLMLLYCFAINNWYDSFNINSNSACRIISYNFNSVINFKTY